HERQAKARVGPDLAEQCFAYEPRAIRSLHVAAENAARTRTDLAPRRGEVLRWEPLPELLRIGPRLVDDLARCIEHSGRDDCPLRRGYAISYGHVFCL